VRISGDVVTGQDAACAVLVDIYISPDGDPVPPGSIGLNPAHLD
jgi:hypothetical protein